MCITKETKYQCRKDLQRSAFPSTHFRGEDVSASQLICNRGRTEPMYPDYPCSLDLFKQSGLDCHSFRQYFRAHYWPSTVSSPKGNNKLMMLFSTLQSKRGIGTSFQVTILDGNESMPLEVQTRKKYIVKTCLTYSCHVPMD